jgi:glycosyltransferase involved in cell wall biosynthesis
VPLTRRLRDAARRAIEVVPAPRGDALRTLGRDVLRDARDLAVGQEPLVPAKARREPPIDYGRLRRAAAALQRGDTETTLVETAAILAEHPTSRRALRLQRDALVRRGDESERLRTVSRLRRIEDDRALQQESGRITSRLRETDPRWLPRVPGPVRPVDPRASGVILHLLKESLPYRQTGFSLRSQQTLLTSVEVGLEPVVVTQPNFPRDQGVADVPATEEVGGIRHHRLDLGPDYVKVPVDTRLEDYAWLAARIARQERPDIVHAGSGHSGYDGALVGLAVAAHIARPMVYEVRSFFETTWTRDESIAETGERHHRRAAQELRCMLAADVVITIADTMRDELVRRGVPGERIHLAYNGVDPDALQAGDTDDAGSDPAARELRASLGLGERFVIGYISNLDHPREGHEVLLHATRRLRDRGRDVACLLVGDGGRRAELEALAKQLGIADRVVFTGRVPSAEVGRYYAAIDAFVVPRIDELAARLVTPLKPFEAMALGRPMLVSDLPALTEIVPHEQRGLVFPAGDADGLAALVERSMDRPDERAALAEAGRAWVLAERTWRSNGPRLLAAYDAARERFAERRGGAAGGGRD